MASPSKNWTGILDTQIDADSPLDTTLLTEIRDNLVNLKEWLGKNYTPAVDHSHDGVDSKPVTSLADGAATQRKLEFYTPGTVQIAANDAVKAYGTLNLWVKQKEIKINRGGNLRIYFEHRNTIGGGPEYAQVYRNGVAAGAQRSTLSGVFVGYSEDIGGWSAGDLCQLYAYNSGGSEGGEVQNFRISADWVLIWLIRLSEVLGRRSRGFLHKTKAPLPRSRGCEDRIIICGTGRVK